MKLHWIEEARQEAAQCWCNKETEKKEMDVELAEAVAKQIAAWMEISAQNQRNTDYYRGLVERIGEAIGHEAYVQDDGGVCEDVLCAKVPELVDRLLKDNAALRHMLGRVQFGAGDMGRCPLCGGVRDMGHKPDCELARLKGGDA